MQCIVQLLFESTKNRLNRSTLSSGHSQEWSEAWSVEVSNAILQQKYIHIVCTEKVILCLSKGLEENWIRRELAFLTQLVGHSIGSNQKVRNMSRFAKENRPKVTFSRSIWTLTLLMWRLLEHLWVSHSRSIAHRWLQWLLCWSDWSSKRSPWLARIVSMEEEYAMACKVCTAGNDDRPSSPVYHESVPMVQCWNQGLRLIHYGWQRRFVSSPDQRRSCSVPPPME